MFFSEYSELEILALDATFFLAFSDGIALKDDQHHIISEGNSGACYLVLTSVSMDDSGQYMCYATNLMGNASTLAKIIVDGKHNRDLKCKLSFSSTYSSTNMHIMTTLSYTSNLAKQ